MRALKVLGFLVLTSAVLAACNPKGLSGTNQAVSDDQELSAYSDSEPQEIETIEIPSIDLSAAAQEHCVDRLFTADDFAKIQHGQSYETVQSILGVEGNPLQGTRLAGTPTYVFYGAANGMTTAIAVAFQSDQAVLFASEGISTTPTTLSKELYEQITRDQPYESVKQLLGGNDGMKVYEDHSNQKVIQYYEWIQDADHYLYVRFDDGKAVAKSQKGIEKSK